MKISDAFPSDYLKASVDVQQPITLTMTDADMVTMNGEDKRVLSFKSNKKGLVLNKTNARTLSDMFGEDTDDWAGHPVTLVSVPVEFQGKVVDAIRIRPPAKTRAAKAKLTPAAEIIGDDFPENLK